MWNELRGHRRFRPAFAGVLLAAVLVTAMVATPLGTAAGQALGIFRVNKFAVIQVNADQLRQLRGYDTKIFSEPQVQGQNAQPVAGASEAAQAAGFPVLLPAQLPDGMSAPSFRVQGAHQAQTEVDLDAARALLTSAGLPTDGMPANQHRITVKAAIPPAVMIDYTGSGNRRISIIEGTSPTVDVPAGVDLARVGETGLRLLGLSPQDAQSLSQKIDWSTTLVIPVPRNAASVEPVQVQGNEGYLFRSTGSTNGNAAGSKPGSVEDSVLVWQANGHLYAVAGNVSSTQLISVAASLR